jgi:hypothetical protein
VVLHADLRDAVGKGPAIGLALAEEQVRVGRPDDYVERLRMHGDDRWQRVDRELVALARAQEPKAQDHVPIGDAQRRFDGRGFHERNVRDAVGNDANAPWIDSVGLAQEVRGGARHHDGCLGDRDQLAQDRALVGRRVAQDRMERGHDRDVQGAREVDDVVAILAAPDAVLVLDRHDVDAVVQRAGSSEVVGVLVLPDPVVDLGRVERRLLGWVQDRDLPATGGARQVMGEGRDSAAARRVR